MSFKDNNALILKEITMACDTVNEAQADLLVDAVLAAEKIFLIGVGRVKLSLEAFSKRLNHLGIKAFVVGDINEPAITEKDLLIVGSGSGETVIPLSIARIAKRYNAKVAHIGSNPESSLKELTDVFVRIPVKTKLNLPDELNSEQIMSSLFEQTLYIVCDSVAMTIAGRKSLVIKDLWQYHANLE